MNKINSKEFMAEINIRKTFMEKGNILKEFVSKINLKKHIKIIYLSVFVIVGIAALVLMSSFLKQGKTPKNNFPNGLLALNTNKSIYASNERVEIGLGSLDPTGSILCHSNLKLEITGPDKIKIDLTTENGKIVNTCSEDSNATLDPDYRTNFIPEKEGIYDLKLKNLDTKVSVESQIEVKSKQKFSIARTGVTRANPFKSSRYPMILTVKSQEGFKGQVIDQIPASFDIVWQGISKVEVVKEYRTITWNVDLKAGEAKELIYEYQAPKVSPMFFNLGKASLVENGKKVFEDSHLWKIIIGSNSN